MQEDNLTLQADEIQAMCAIYGHDWTTVSEATRTYNICIKLDKQREVNLEVSLPAKYPTEEPPFYQLSAPWLRSIDKLHLIESLEDIYCNHIGESVLYLWIERVREFLSDKFAEMSDDNPSRNATFVTRELLEFASSYDDNSAQLPDIIHGEPVTHKKSTFQAHLATVVTVDQVTRLLRKLKEDRKIANATHNMYAYRILNKANGASIQDCDDDGEAHAGSRLLHLLQILDVSNVLVVVTRWYGGVLLGPDRFRYINNCARDVLLQSNRIKGAKGDK